MRRLAMHAAAIGLSALLLGAGLNFVWNHGPKRPLAGDTGGSGGGGGPPAAAEEADFGFGVIPAGTERPADAGRGAGAGSGAGSFPKRDGAASADSGTEGEPTVRLLFVGDIMMGGRVADLLEREGYDYPYRHVGEALRNADLAAGNLENPITDRGEPADKTWTFRTSPLAVPALKESGIDVLSLANNHVLDYGTEGLLDTLRYLDGEEIGRTGAGKDAEEAYRPFFADVKGVRVACIGLSHVVPEVGWKAGKNHPGVAEAYDTRRAVEAIREAKEQADLVVVMVHWGIERAEEPEPYQVRKGRQFIDAGADLVIGSHPHVLQGIESYKGKWIAYSLGNFIFTVSGNADTYQSAMLQADCRAGGDCRLTVVPVVTGPGQPYFPDEDAARAILEKMNRLSYQARVNDDGTVAADPAGRVYDPEKAARKKTETAEKAKSAADNPAPAANGTDGAKQEDETSGAKQSDGKTDSRTSSAGAAENGSPPAGWSGEADQPGSGDGQISPGGRTSGQASRTDEAASPGPAAGGLPEQTGNPGPASDGTDRADSPEGGTIH